MKGKIEIIEKLNYLLADELTAVGQYMVQAITCENWGYAKLNDVIEKRAIMEMKHAEKLIQRIIFLEGMPVVWELGDFTIGSSVPEFHSGDREKEINAIEQYNIGIALVKDLGDWGTQELLQDNLEDEESHLLWIEAQLEQLSQMGLTNYLSMQV
jgi:bacterioferritin